MGNRGSRQIDEAMASSSRSLIARKKDLSHRRGVELVPEMIRVPDVGKCMDLMLAAGLGRASTAAF